MLCISKHRLQKSINTHNNPIQPFLKMLQLFARVLGYDYKEILQVLQQWGYVGHIPAKDDAKLLIQDIPNYRARRWVVERTHSWMNRFRRILIRWEKSIDN